MRVLMKCTLLELAHEVARDFGLVTQRCMPCDVVDLYVCHVTIVRLAALGRNGLRHILPARVTLRYPCLPYAAFLLSNWYA